MHYRDILINSFCRCYHERDRAPGNCSLPPSPPNQPCFSLQFTGSRWASPAKRLSSLPLRHLASSCVVQDSWETQRKSLPDRRRNRPRTHEKLAPSHSNQLQVLDWGGGLLSLSRKKSCSSWAQRRSRQSTTAITCRFASHPSPSPPLFINYSPLPKPRPSR